MRSGFLSLGRGRQIADAESGCRRADGEGVDALATGFQILDAWEDDLCSRKLVEFLLRHRSSLDGGFDFEARPQSSGGPTPFVAIVWSMKVIETAKIIAVKIELLFLVDEWVTPSPCRGGGDSFPPSGKVAAAMPPVFWLGLGIAATFFLVGCISGARSRTASLRTGAAIGAYLGVMAAFPLLAIGLATS